MQLFNEASFVAVRAHALLVEARHPTGTVKLYSVKQLGGNDTGKVELTFVGTLGLSQFFFTDLIAPTRNTL